MIQIDVVNRTTHVTDAQLAAVVAALQIQADRDFSPIWNTALKLNVVARGTANPAHWWLGLFDTADVANALGYHDVTSAGLPLGKVFVETTTKNGGLWSVTASHELCEMAADPEINLIAQAGGRLFAYETCDAVERDPDGYDINTGAGNIRVSNFVTPFYFGPRRKGVAFDFRKLLPGPAPRMLPGGYLSELTANGWTQLYADSASIANARARPEIGSRRERRRTERAAWRVSTGT